MKDDDDRLEEMREENAEAIGDLVFFCCVWFLALLAGVVLVTAVLWILFGSW